MEQQQRKPLKTIEDVMEQLKRMTAFPDSSTDPSMTSISVPTPKKVYECDVCQDRGFVFISNDEGKICDCSKIRKRNRLFSKSGLSEEFRSLSFESFDLENCPPIVESMFKSAVLYRRKFKEIRKGRRNSIMMLGSSGSGKTHLLSAVANELMRNDLIGVVYFPYVEGFNSLREDFDKLPEKIEAMQTCDVLFIDDLYKGRGRPTEFVTEQLYAVLNARYLNHLPIMISSERSVTELLDIDEATGSRMVEMSKDYLLQVEGDRYDVNYRLRNT